MEKFESINFISFLDESFKETTENDKKQRISLLIKKKEEGIHNLIRAKDTRFGKRKYST